MTKRQNYQILENTLPFSWQRSKIILLLLNLCFSVGFKENWTFMTNDKVKII